MFGAGEEGVGVKGGILDPAAFAVAVSCACLLQP